MANVTANRSRFRIGLPSWLNDMVIAHRARNARRRAYLTTLRELNCLTERELADLGLHRSEIRRVAWQAAYEV